MPARYKPLHQPLQSSLLKDGPDTPSVPEHPVSPLASPHHHPSSPHSTSTQPLHMRRSSHSPSPSPLPWLWQCHSCHRAYPLGTTRRCLDCGHTFCSGEVHTTENIMDRRARRYMKRGKACNSEFDYEGWSAYTRWARSVNATAGEQRRGSKQIHDCWRDCSYPSECKWGGGDKLEEELVPLALEAGKRVEPGAVDARSKMEWIPEDYDEGYVSGSGMEDVVMKELRALKGRGDGGGRKLFGIV